MAELLASHSFTVTIPRPSGWKRRFLHYAATGVPSHAAAVAMTLCIFAVATQALDPAKALREYNCQAWTFHNGLPVNGVSALAQSVDGYLWLGTHRGLVRFDGDDFDVLGPGAWQDIRSMNVHSLCPSREGGVWFAAENSAFAYCNGPKSWRRGEAKVGDMWAVTCLAEDTNGVVWAGGQYLKHRRGVESETQAVPDFGIADMISMHADRHGRVWIGTAHRGLYWLDSGKIGHLHDPSLNERVIFAIDRDAQDNVWLGTQMGVICLDSQLQRRQLSLPEYEVRALCADHLGALWIGTTGGGLLRWVNDRLEQFRKSDGLCDDSVLSLLEDREGSLWVGTRFGLSQLTDVKFPLISDSRGVSVKSVLSVSPAQDGSVWLATSDGIFKYDGWGHQYGGDTGSSQPYTRYTKRIHESRHGELYATSGDNVVRVLSGGHLVAQLPTMDMPVALAEDSHSVLISAGGNLFRASPTALTPYEFKNGKAPALYWILNLWAGSDDAIWAASVNGVARIHAGEFQQWTQADGLADHNVRWVMQDREGTVWIGAATALSRLQKGQITNVRRQDGLPDASIQAIVDDERGFLWVDSGSGLYRVSKASLEAFANHQTSRVDCIRHDGPESVQPTDRLEQESSGCRTPDGRIWFPRATGALMIDPAHVPTNQVSPPVRIESVRANGVELDRDMAKRIPSGHSTLSFHFVALTFVGTAQVQYRYRLEGYDANWTEAGNRSDATYSNVKPGAYTFRVQACNADGVWNRTGDCFQLAILPQFYETKWFVLMCALAGAGLPAGAYRWRVRSLSEKERAAAAARVLLERTVQERTAELEARRVELEQEIERRTQMQQTLERTQERLLTASREAGMAEVATGVLHNVGNVLNSVNVSTTWIADRIRSSKVSNLSKAVHMLQEHTPDLAAYLTQDPKGQMLPSYLRELADHLGKERNRLLEETAVLARNVEHIKEIVVTQQSYAKLGGVLESLSVITILEDAFQLNAASFQRIGVEVIRHYEEVPPLMIDKHKILQILLNLLRNASYAMEVQPEPVSKRLTLTVSLHDPSRITISVQDNGIGIAPENLTRIFSYGFTTKKNGHGFGLHLGALSAKEMGGSLIAYSEGPGRGAIFTLELPITNQNTQL